MRHIEIRSNGLLGAHARVWGVDDETDDMEDLTEELGVYKIEIEMNVDQINRVKLYCYGSVEVDAALDEIERKYIDPVPD